MLETNSIPGLLGSTAGSNKAANSRQVGGGHYKTAHGLEHWDLVHIFKLDYFQGQITKYVMRWRQKGGIQDLEKARHFLDKYIELERGVLAPQPAPVQESEKLVKPWDTNHHAPDQAGNDHWQLEGYYGDGTCLYTCRSCKVTTRRWAAPVQPHGCARTGALEPSDGLL